MHVVAGTLAPDSGDIAVAGMNQADYRVTMAQRLGIRCVFQELSLCPNLSVAENAHIYHADMKGLGWRQRASNLIQTKLDEIFPGHGIGPADVIRDLPISKRQMVEVARAFTVTATAIASCRSRRADLLARQPQRRSTPAFRSPNRCRWHELHPDLPSVE